MKKIEESYDVGVIIARFQVDELHDAHLELIQYVVDRHPKVIIILGLSPCKCTVNNPLDFESRKQMILEKFPEVIVVYTKDCHSDVLWSQNLDERLDDIIGANQSVVLYGGRDSFIKHYFGKNPTIELEQMAFISGTARRKALSNKVKGSADFRHGVIWATQNQYPKCFPTVDIALLNENHTRILLGRKRYEKEFRFPGGFVMPGQTLEDTAVRETKEETGVDIQNPCYVGSFVIDDWRYRSEVDKITTTLFVTDEISGRPCPGDDIAEVRWFEYGEELLGQIRDEHQQLFEAVLAAYPPQNNPTEEEVLERGHM